MAKKKDLLNEMADKPQKTVAELEAELKNLEAETIEDAIKTADSEAEAEGVDSPIVTVEEVQETIAVGPNIPENTKVKVMSIVDTTRLYGHDTKVMEKMGETFTTIGGGEGCVMNQKGFLFSTNDLKIVE